MPIFMSASSDHLHRTHSDEEAARAATIPHAHRQSVEDDERRTVSTSSVYSQSPNVQVQRTFMDQSEEEPRSRSPEPTHDLEAGISTSSYASSEAELVREKRRKRRRVAESYRERIAAKKRLGVAFGVTTLAAVITCEYPLEMSSRVLIHYRRCAGCDGSGQRDHVPCALCGIHPDPDGRVPT